MQFAELCNLFITFLGNNMIAFGWAWTICFGQKQTNTKESQKKTKNLLKSMDLILMSLT